MTGLDAKAEERLREARGIVADVAHHRPEEVGLACLTIWVLSTDAAERAEASELLRLVAAPPPVAARNPAKQQEKRR